MYWRRRGSCGETEGGGRGRESMKMEDKEKQTRMEKGRRKENETRRKSCEGAGRN